MKKIMMIVFAAAFVFASGAAYAETVKEAAQAAAKSSGDFWAKEGERSGWKESTSSWGKFWENANPVKFFHDQQEAYNARRVGSVAK